MSATQTAATMAQRDGTGNTRGDRDEADEDKGCGRSTAAQPSADA